MKNMILAVLALMISVSFASAANADELKALMNEANDYYAEDDFENALASYKEIEASGFESAALYYNMGNVYFRLSDAARAILYYERALRLDPSNSDIHANLEMAHQYTADKIEQVPEFVMLSWLKQFKSSVSANAWAWISIICLCVACALLLVYFYGRIPSTRKLCFVFSIVALFFFVVSGAFSLSQKSEIMNENYAVVMEEVSSVRGAPDESAKGLFVLHSGTKVMIIEKIGNWTRIELTDGRQGWLLSNEIEII